MFLELLACSVYDDDPNPPPVGQMDNPPKHGARNARYRLNGDFRTGWNGHFLNSVTCYILFERFFANGNRRIMPGRRRPIRSRPSTPWQTVQEATGIGLGPGEPSKQDSKGS